MKNKQNIAAEFIGSFFLLAIVVGSGIMGERLSGGSVALELLANSVATGAGLIVLILVFGPISGAHFNPLVSLAEFFHKNISKLNLFYYIFAQVWGGICGVIFTHLMFNEPWVSFSNRDRSGFSLMLSEFIATFGLIIIIRIMSSHRKKDIPFAVGLYITSAYWFTSSTSFANPAVTIARTLTSTFTGINQRDVIGFIIAQILGAFFAELTYFYFFKKEIA